MVSKRSFFSSKLFKITFGIYIGLFSLVWLLSSPVIKHFITPQLAQFNLELSEESSIRFNPFLTRVTLSDITLYKVEDSQKEKVFSLGEMSLQLTLWQLLFDKIVLSNFESEQAFLKVSQHDDRLVVAGIEIKEEQKTQPTTTQDVKPEPTAFSYQLISPEFLLKNFDIEIEKNTHNEGNKEVNKTHHIEVKQFTLTDVKATSAEQQAQLSLTALVDKTQLSINANTQLNEGQGDINSDITLNNYPLEKLAHYIKPFVQLQGSLSFHSQQRVTLAGDTVKLLVHQAKLENNDLLIALDNQQFTLKHYQHNLNEVALDLLSGEVTHLAGKSNIKLTDAAINQGAKKHHLLAFDALTLAEIDFVLDEEPSIDIADIILDQLIFSKRAALEPSVAQKAIDKINKVSAKEHIEISAEDIVKLPPVLQLKQLTLEELHIHQNSIDINNIIFDNITGEVIVKEDKSIANLIKLLEEPSKVATNEAITEVNTGSQVKEVMQADTETTAKVPTEKDNFQFSVNSVRFINENTLDFTDFSVEPIYQRTLFIDTLDIGALSNHQDKRNIQTPYALVGRSNKYANFNLSGYLQPFSDVANYHIKGDFKEFSLPAISSYMKEATGIEVKTGQLNTALDINLAGEKLDGNVVVLLQGLETGLVDSDEAGSLIDQGALPLNMAMGMLKDSDGNVELDVPLSGSTSDPSFGFHSIITLITQKAILSATQDYLMTTFVPYANIVSVAITAGQFALKLRFDDLPYQVKQVEPNSNQQEYLQQFIALMQDKEDTRVSICAISTPEDINLTSGSEVTNKADIKRLKAIGEKREHALKDYLIEHGKISSSRLLFCKPQIDSSEGAIPRISISV